MIIKIPIIQISTILTLTRSPDNHIPLTYRINTSKRSQRGSYQKSLLTDSSALNRPFSFHIYRVREREMGDEKIKNEAMEIMGFFQVLPRLVVFDLDYTLWPFYCECRSKREMPKLYPHAKGILLALKEKGVDVAIASRSPTADIAKTFLDKLDIKSMLVAQEIYSSWTHKTEHFQSINRRTGVPFNSMLFFDDEDRNIEAVSKMGVRSILVDDGVNLEAFRQGLTEFSQNSGSSERNKQK